MWWTPVPAVLILLTLILCCAWTLSTHIKIAALTVYPCYLKASDMRETRQKLGARYVSIDSPAGKLPALYFPGRQDNPMVICLHGKGGSMYENGWVIPRLASAMGLPAMSVSYRGDQGAPPAAMHSYGKTEWEDLEAAVSHAIDEYGAEDIILAANSYGAGVAAAFLRNSPYAAQVRGVIFDAPMLSLRQCIRQVGRSLRFGTLIMPLIRLAEILAARRFGVDYDAVDYLRDVSWLNVPALVFHGDDDSIVPVRTSVELKNLRPELVMLERAPAGHGGMASQRSYLPLARAFLAHISN